MSLNDGHHWDSLIFALVLGVMSTACEPRTSEEADRITAVLEHLIDTNGMGQFEPSAVYCIAVNERGGDASEEVLNGVRQNSGLRILAAGECTYDQAIDSVVETDERTPAVLIWARGASDPELEQFTREAWKDILAGAHVVRAGFYAGESASADDFCLVTSAQDPEVIQCDLGSIS